MGKLGLGIFVKNSSKDAVVKGARHIKKYYIAQNKLISGQNPLDKNGKQIKNHADDSKSYRIKQSDINSFLAASTLSHLIDGWSYLSCSFEALINGDSSTCVHLAYYSELRSAMSILATEGIGVFNDKHLAVFSEETNCEYPKNYYKGIHPNVKYVKGGLPTHKFVWDAMEKWTNSAFRPHPDILEIFSVKGKNFNELTEYFHPQATVFMNVEIIKSWLKEWSFDIKSYKLDREGRNVVSYRPQRIKNFNQKLDFKEIINSLDKFWQVLSPLSDDRFNLLDIYLLRKLYKALYSRINPSESYRVLVERAFNQLGLHDNNLINLLCSETPYENDHLVFTLASKEETSPLSILARSTLLLRISAGNTSQIFKMADISKNDLNFVWENYGVDNGFWESGSMPIDFSELWSDVHENIRNLKERVNEPTSNNDLASIIKDNGFDLPYFQQINRACLWGLNF